MPYITQKTRERLHEYWDDADNAGELNYQITRLLNAYIKHAPIGLRYDTINDIIGALEGAKLEFYRRVVAPYEDKKILENGDVY